MEKEAKKKVVRKRKTASAAGVEARLNKRMKGLEGSIDLLLEKVDAFVQRETGPQTVPSPPQEEALPEQPVELQVGDFVPLEEGKEYKFMSPHLSFKLLLGGGVRVPIDGYGNYELTPVEIADFSELSDGPMGFYKTDVHAWVKELRAYIKKQVRKEIVEVTDDPTYAHV